MVLKQAASSNGGLKGFSLAELLFLLLTIPECYTLTETGDMMDKIVLNNIIERHYGCSLSVYDCHRLCVANERCQTFFYNDILERCQLHSETFQAVGLENLTVYNKTGWKYYNIDYDCESLYLLGERTSGVYEIYSRNTSWLSVYCDMDTDGGGWTVFQRRLDGSVDFYRNWNEYYNGFGNINGEYWLGNKFIHSMTSHTPYSLRVDLEDQAGVWKYAVYDSFQISDNSTGFILSVGSYSGNAGDGLTYHNGRRFATIDRDYNDCVTKFKGAWWPVTCHRSNLNGEYDNNKFGQGINWYYWRGHEYSMKSAMMKIKRI